MCITTNGIEDVTWSNKICARFWGKQHIYTKNQCHFLKITSKFASIENLTLCLPHIKMPFFINSRDIALFHDKLTFLREIDFSRENDFFL